MRRSESIVNLVKALCAAQAVMGDAHKATKNTFFNSKYADLSEVWDACRGPLTENGLSVVQTIEPHSPVSSYEAARETAAAVAPDILKASLEGISARASTRDGYITVVTTLYHSSGEWIESVIQMPVMEAPFSKEDKRLVRTPQAYGSAITYARRYLLAAIVGVAQSDDDGNQASRGKGNASEAVMEIRSEVVDMMAKFDEFTEADAIRPAYEKFRKDHPDLNVLEAKSLHNKAAKRAQQIRESTPPKPENETQEPEGT